MFFRSDARRHHDCGYPLNDPQHVMVGVARYTGRLWATLRLVSRELAQRHQAHPAIGEVIGEERSASRRRTRHPIRSEAGCEAELRSDHHQVVVRLQRVWTSALVGAGQDTQPVVSKLRFDRLQASSAPADSAPVREEDVALNLPQGFEVMAQPKAGAHVAE